MSVMVPVKFGMISVLLGNGASPEVFSAPCGVTSINWSNPTNTSDEDLPDCADPDAVSYSSPQITSVGDQIQIQGFIDDAGSDLWYAAISAGQPINVKIVYNATTKKGTYLFPAIITAREESYERRMSGKINVTIRAKSRPVWTAAS